MDAREEILTSLLKPSSEHLHHPPPHTRPWISVTIKTGLARLVRVSTFLWLRQCQRGGVSNSSSQIENVILFFRWPHLALGPPWKNVRQGCPHLKKKGTVGASKALSEMSWEKEEGGKKGQEL